MPKFAQSLCGPASKVGHYDISWDDNSIRVGFESAEPTFCSRETGFVEGLWCYDCGELFLSQPVTGRYLEINIAPNGGWWSCVFSDVRKRDLGGLPPQIENVFGQPETGGWIAGFSLSFAEVVRCLGSAEDLRGNVTLILGGCPDVDPHLANLHSVANLGVVDFHRPHEWLPLDELLT